MYGEPFLREPNRDYGVLSGDATPILTFNFFLGPDGRTALRALRRLFFLLELLPDADMRTDGYLEASQRWSIDCPTTDS